MWKLWRDNSGAVSWLMNQIGLVIAAGIILASAVAVPYYGGWQSKLAADGMGLKIIGAITSVDSSFIPAKINISIPGDRSYVINISSSFITVKVKDGFFGTVTCVKKIPCKVFVRKSSDAWRNSKELYSFIENRYGCKKEDGFYPSNCINEIKNYLADEYESSIKSLALTPLTTKNGEVLTAEKCIIYFDDYSHESVVILYKEEI